MMIFLHVLYNACASDPAFPSGSFSTIAVISLQQQQHDLLSVAGRLHVYVCVCLCREAVQLAEEAAEGKGGGVGHFP